MYPARDLKRLARHKAYLQRRIANHRAECADALIELSRPLHWVDKGLALWRKFSPLAKIFGVPLGAIATRAVFKRLGRFGSVARWAPMLFGLVRGFRAGSKT